jgi:hypothetical protein
MPRTITVKTDDSQMKRLLFPLLILWFALLQACTIPTNSFGVTCVQSSGNGGIQTNIASKTVNTTTGVPNWTASTSGDMIAVLAYNCWNSNCGATGSTTLSVSDNLADPDTNFVISPSGIFTIIETCTSCSSNPAQTLQQAMWVRPNSPSITSITVNVCPSSTPNCSTSQAVAQGNYITLYAVELGGMATSSPWDVDGGGQGPGLTTTGTMTTCSWSNSTGACGANKSTTHTNELCVGFMDNTNDETMSAGTATTIMAQFTAGNVLTGSIVTTPGVVTQSTTWTVADNYYGTLGCLLSAQSAPARQVH